jgi:N-acetylglucosamine malate deacetylase 1
LLVAARRVAALVLDRKPATVYAPWVGEQHVDHHVLARAVRLGLSIAAFRGRAFGYEVWSPLVPTRVVDVSADWELKARALGEHRSQLATTDLVHMVRGLNAHRSLYLAKGARYGEAFAPLGEPHPDDAKMLAATAEVAR